MPTTSTAIVGSIVSIGSKAPPAKINQPITPSAKPSKRMAQGPIDTGTPEMGNESALA